MVNRGLTRGGRVLITLFLLGFMAMGVLLTVFFIKQTAQTRRSRSWKPTPCVILRSFVEDVRLHSDREYRPAIRFGYEWEGMKLESSQLQLQSSRHENYSRSLRVVHRYPEGSSQTCLVNPMQPTEAVLETNSPFLILWALIPLFFVAFGAGSLYFIWRRPADPRSALSAKKRGFAPAWFGAIFFAVGLGGFAFAGAFPIVKIISARNWKKLPCKVISSEVLSRSGGRGGMAYRPNILYSYQVNEREFRSNRYKFSPVSSSGRESKYAIIRRYATGLQTNCFVNPRDPYDAVLNRGFTPDIFVALLPLMFIIGGALVMLEARKRRIRSHPVPA